MHFFEDFAPFSFTFLWFLGLKTFFYIYTNWLQIIAYQVASPSGLRHQSLPTGFIFWCVRKILLVTAINEKNK